jgi:hypothetical protein
MAGTLVLVADRGTADYPYAGMRLSARHHRAVLLVRHRIDIAVLVLLTGEVHTADGSSAYLDNFCCFK